MSVEAPHQPKQTQESATKLTAEQQAWKDQQEAQWAEYHAKTASENSPEEQSFLESVFNENVVPTSEAEQAMGRTSESEEKDKDKGPSRLSRIKSSLGAIATKIGDVFTIQKSGMPQSPEEFKLSPSQTTEAASKKPETEKQPRFDLVDIKARAVKIVDRTKYNLGLAKEIGVEVKDILVEKAKDKFDNKDEVLAAAKEKVARAKDVGIGFAQFAAYEGLSLFGALANKAAELTKDAPSKLSGRFTEAAPTSSNPENRRLNRRGKILVLGLGIAASAGALYLGIEGGTEGTAELANQVPLDNSGADSIGMYPDLQSNPLPVEGDIPTPSPENIPSDQLPLSSDVMPDVASDVPTPVEPTSADLKPDFSPEIGTLQAGDTIWDDSMQMLKESGFDGGEQELVNYTNLLTDWRLKEMGITAEQATSLPVGTKLPMPEFADIQEIIAKAEQLRQ